MRIKNNNTSMIGKNICQIISVTTSSKGFYILFCSRSDKNKQRENRIQITVQECAAHIIYQQVDSTPSKAMILRLQASYKAAIRQKQYKMIAKAPMIYR